jgi:hypothetical protein
VRFLVGKTEAEAVEQQVTPKPGDNGGITYSAYREIDFADGQCPVWLRVIELKALAKEPFVLNTMAYPTRHLTVDLNVTGADRPLEFHAELMGGFGRVTPPLPRRYGCKLEYGGWLLEDHGYFIHWW